MNVPPALIDISAVVFTDQLIALRAGALEGANGIPAAAHASGAPVLAFVDIFTASGYSIGYLSTRARLASECARHVDTLRVSQTGIHRLLTLVDVNAANRLVVLVVALASLLTGE